MKWSRREKRFKIHHASGRNLGIGGIPRGRSRRRRNWRRKNWCRRNWRGKIRNGHLYLAVSGLCLLAAGSLFLWGRRMPEKQEVSAVPVDAETQELTEVSSSGGIEELLAQADRAAAQYDYDGAEKLLAGDGKNADDPRVQKKLGDIEAVKATLEEQDVSQITHVFFHILVEDPARTFLDTKQGRGYNSVMTTVPEFKKILEEMYRRGYVLVKLHDIAAIKKDETGKEIMEEQKILLPPGKKAFVMSQDDVNYYEYMEGTGCADKMLLDEDGKPACEYVDSEGNTHIGAYDLVPILDDFVEEHPDFSYRGAKAVLALTGYNGVLGYRTDETYDAACAGYDANMKANPNIGADRLYVKKLTQALKEDGYEFACHSWGHRDYGKIELDHMKADADRWEKNVAPLLPDACDVMIYPFGSDISTWKPYDDGNEKYRYLDSLGFRYFCNVDSSPYWVQKGDRFFRQARRNLDGYRLWMDYGGGESRLSDLMDVKKVFDVRRHTPIGWQ